MNNVESVKPEHFDRLYTLYSLYPVRGTANYSFILSISVRFTPNTLRIAFKERDSSFNYPVNTHSMGRYLYLNPAGRGSALLLLPEFIQNGILFRQAVLSQFIQPDEEKLLLVAEIKQCHTDPAGSFSLFFQTA